MMNILIVSMLVVVVGALPDAFICILCRVSEPSYRWMNVMLILLRYLPTAVGGAKYCHLLCKVMR